MALLGPMVVVAERLATDLLDALGRAGAFPIVETSLADAPAAIAEIQPAALVFGNPNDTPRPRLARLLMECIETRRGPVMPVLALVNAESALPVPIALSVAPDEPFERMLSRVRSALRVRSLHAAVLRRAHSSEAKITLPTPAPVDLLDDATVLCVGRGGSYPALSVAIGERVGLIGTLGVETAARYLNTRDIDGVVVGEGLGPRVVEALLTVLAEDARFRDLPIGVLNNAGADDERLPNLVRVDGDPVRLVDRLLPFVRLQMFETRLKRTLKSLETEGVIDADTGLLGRAAFWRDLDRAVHEAGDRGGALSIARFSFEGVSDRRAQVDAARLFSRLVRNIDFACREEDGAILAAFTETDLRSAHVVARRIARVLKHTLLSPNHDRDTIKPTITLATLKSDDTLSSLVTRVGSYPEIAAE